MMLATRQVWPELNCQHFYLLFSSITSLVRLVVDLLKRPFGSVVFLDLTTVFLFPSESTVISVDVWRSRVVPSESV